MKYLCYHSHISRSINDLTFLNKSTNTFENELSVSKISDNLSKLLFMISLLKKTFSFYHGNTWSIFLTIIVPEHQIIHKIVSQTSLDVFNVIYVLIDIFIQFVSYWTKVLYWSPKKSFSKDDSTPCLKAPNLPASKFPFYLSSWNHVICVTRMTFINNKPPFWKG